MATVNNATGVYATLGYNFSDPNGDVISLSANTTNHLNSMPAFIESWQAKDIANDQVNGYYQNPVAPTVNTIINISANMETEADTGVMQGIVGCELILTAAEALTSTAQTFLEHTNRISGVTPYTGQDIENPYYDNAIGLGKTALYITNQTDNITDMSPIMGSFTSILIGPQIEEIVTPLQNSLQILSTGVAANNLTSGEVSEILLGISNTDSLLSSRRTADVTYYTNLRSFVDKYNIVKKFTNMGETESYLVNNFVGTDKIKERIN